MHRYTICVLRLWTTLLIASAGILLNGQVQTERATAANLPVLQQQICSQESALRSIDGKTSTHIQFVNQTPETVSIYWLNYSGQRVLYNVLPPGAMYLQQTYLTHPWVATDPIGNCIGIFMPQVMEASAVITMPTLPQQSCSLEGTLRSSFGARTSILFVNRTPDTVHLWWLDYSGKRQDRGIISPGGSLLELTYVSHPFVLANSSGVCIGIFVAQLSPSVAVLAMPDVTWAIADALAGGGISGPGAQGIAHSLTKQWAAVQADLAGGNNTQALSDILSFVCHLHAQSGKKISPTTAQLLTMDAMPYYTDAGGTLPFPNC